MLMRYFKGSILMTVLGLFLGGLVGYAAGGPAMALSTLFICAVLGVLEVSLSFDNAVVNAKILRTMDEVWRRRFITWGIAIAVFGMRIVFPLVIVAVLGRINPLEALVLALTRPDQYTAILTSSHAALMGFGGAFLLMVALKYFFDVEKTVHWVHVIEAPLTRLGKLQAAEIAITLLALAGVATLMPHDAMSFLLAGLMGLVTFILVDGLGAFFERPEAGTDVAKAGLASFLYLEVLDASFSFDGVIGAFALSKNILVIAIGLGIGAMFVRSLTIMLVDRGTLSQFIFLEHGAFFAIGALAVIMFLQTTFHIPEVITGLIGAAFIGLSFISSIRHRKKLENVLDLEPLLPASEEARSAGSPES